MSRLLRKLTARRGETLTETLVALLIICLASAALAVMVTAASRLNAAAMKNDADLYAAVTQAETATGTPAPGTPPTGIVTVTVDGNSSDPITFNVNYYGDGTLTSYRKGAGS